MTLLAAQSAQTAGDTATVATLPMYDAPALHAANDALWRAISDHLATEGIDAPAALTRDADPDIAWRDPNLLLSQTCGLPLMTSLRGAVKLVATPRYRAPGCAGPFYRSALVVGAGSPAGALADLRGARCAVNEFQSNSGMNLLRAEIAPLAHGGAFFGEVILTGSHAASLEAVAKGRADLAAIDCVTLAQQRRLRPDLTGAIRVLGWTHASPGLPLITSLSTPAATLEALRRALDYVALDPRMAEVRRELLLDGFNVLPETQYALVLHLQQTAIDIGYPVLR